MRGREYFGPTDLNQAVLVLPSGAAEDKSQEEELCLKFDGFSPCGSRGSKNPLFSIHLFLSSKVSLLPFAVFVKQKHDNPFSPSESSSRMLMLSKSSLK